MNKKPIFLLGLLAAAVSIYAQSREDTLIFVMPVEARPDHAVFFKENFDAEIAGAGYTLAGSADEADYLIQLAVRANMFVYEDGTQEPAPPEEPQFLVSLTLIRTEDNTELVAFSYPFTDLEEMYAANLFMVYEAMANVPVTRLGDIEIVAEDDRWRNKWLYLRMSFGYTLSLFMMQGSNDKGELTINYPGDPRDNKHQEKINAPGPGSLAGVNIGLEFQFLNWMSMEGSFLLEYEYEESITIMGGGLQLKFPIKPSRHYMLEPYIMGAYMPTPYRRKLSLENSSSFILGGGFQFGIKAGNSGAFIIDVSCLYSFLEGISRPVGGNVIYDGVKLTPDPENINYDRLHGSVGIGYKVGIGDRPKRGEE